LLSTGDEFGSTSLQKSWRERYNRNHNLEVPGSVYLLSTLTSGHRGNVFHITPVDAAPGKVLTCGADGFLRISDVQTETSSVVVSPCVRDEEIDVYGFHLGMAFSHQMMTEHTGLLCSERGLHHFDLRLSPRQQNHQSLLGDIKDARSYTALRSKSCKACAIWSPMGISKQLEPTYIFAGGSSEFVELLDLRLTGSDKKVLQRYKPRCLAENGSVSVSGLDISKDGRELLVSYESDQIYSFPVFPNVACRAGPTIDEIVLHGDQCIDDGETFVPDIASYGGHLNRFTFLKNARYSGPNDDYIVTGSDSGNAWIYERKSGTVVSLLGADSSTCNGVIPHPSLPFFITYGIDSTAKLWRAASCVDPCLSDSATARSKAFQELPYDMSPVVRSYDGVQALVKRIEEEPSMMPDFVASSEEIASSGRFSSHSRRGINGEDSPHIGNSLRCLPMLLRQNRYECYRAHHDSRSVPVDQPLEQLTHRVSINRLRLQADSLGVKWNPWAPWAFEKERDDIHRADLVPDNPSDWILFDKQMKADSLDVRMNFNFEDFETELQKRFPQEHSFFDRKESELVNTIPWLADGQKALDKLHNPSLLDLDEGREDCNFAFEEKSRRILYETASLLKESGNQAVKDELLKVAARRYDKAIQYCAVAFMQYYEGMTCLKHLREGHKVESASLKYIASIKTGEHVRSAHAIVSWSPLLRIMITSRLNLSLLLMKPEFSQPSRAADQARNALKILFPFTREEGKVVVMLTSGGEKNRDHVVNDTEPIDTYKEAKRLLSKAYFRLGSAEYMMGDYSAAIKSLEASLKALSETAPNSKPDALLLHRLRDAKVKSKAKKKRNRKKYLLLLNEQQENSTGDT
jgi:WD40 repeat protein/tetratricopeptide (TPR) repeat protein